MNKKETERKEAEEYKMEAERKEAEDEKERG